ncbi:MAG: NAD-dependent dehydratase [Pseudanabaena sp.]|nr:MAG: NAD-dependent dehydratase [Pseudanabaena sp.]
MEKQIVLVTGGCGFIGSHLVEKLVQENYYVRVLDNLSTGKLSNLSAVPSEKIEIIIGNVSDFDTVKDAVQNCTYVFHEAAIPSVPQSIADPLSTGRVNYSGTLNTLEASRQCNVKRVIFASSAAVYGNEPTLPKHELMLSQPISPYGADKRASELMGLVYSQISDLEFVALRYFNVFGPRQDPLGSYAGVISIFCNCIKKNMSPIIYGDGTQSRDFIYVSDIVQANLIAMKHPKAKNAIFNVGRGQSVTLNELINTLNKLTDKHVKGYHQPERHGDIRHSVADVSALKALDWTSIMSVHEGLALLLDSLK